MMRPLPLSVVAVIAFALAPAGHAADKPAKEKGAAFLDPTVLHTLHLHVTKEAWDEMQPSRAGFLGNLFSKPADHPEDKKKSPFGLEYTYVHAIVEEGGKTYKDVGLRFKGNSSYTTTERLLKRPFKVDFNHYDADQRFHGLTSINLHNNAMDPSFLRETLSYEAFRQGGVPAPRTGQALVYLTVDGLYAKQLVGLYTVVEEVGKPFLKSHFGSAKGLLLKPENAFNLPYLGEDFTKYEKVYRPHTEANPQTSRRLIEFLKLLHQADDATFAKTIGDYLDIDSFQRFIAVNTLIANLDSFLTTNHNFYMYVHPETLKIHFMPWDMNLSFGAFSWVGSAQDQIELSITQSYAPPNLLLDRLLKMPDYQKGYRKIVEELAQKVIVPQKVTARIDELQKVILQAQKEAFGTTQPTSRPENTAASTMPRWAGSPPELKDFITKRSAAVQAQLAGNLKGYTPAFFRRQALPQPPPAKGPATRSATTRPATTQSTTPPTAPAK